MAATPAFGDAGWAALPAGLTCLLEFSMGANGVLKTPEERKRLQETLHVPKN
jgi:hypothetical protein